MNKRQKQVLVLAVIVAALIGLFPPWVRYTSYPGGREAQPAAHRPLFDPPRVGRDYLAVGVDYGRLLVYWSVVGLVAAGLLAVLHGSPGERGSEGSRGPPELSAEECSLSSPTPNPTSPEELVLAYGRGQLSRAQLLEAYQQGQLSDVDLEEAFLLRGSNPNLPPPHQPPPQPTRPRSPPVRL